jgi:hypothetical protein
VAKIKLEQFENVVANGTAVLTTERLWPNTLEYFVFELGGTFTKAMITRLLIRFGSKVVWDVTGSQLLSMNLFEGRPNTATVLILPFSNSRARHLEQQYIGAPDFGAIGVRKVTIEVTIAGATSPTLAAWAEIAPPKLLSPSQNLMFRALLRQPLTPSAAVVDQAQQINWGQAGGAFLRRMHFFSALVTKLKIKRDGLDYFEDISLAVNNAILDENGWDPQANIFSFNSVEDDNELKALTSIRNDGAGGSLVPQQILMTTSGSGSFEVVSDIFATLNGL